MKTKFLLITLFSFYLFTAHSQVRTEIKIPDILGYKALKCDFHTHTVYSDGFVWPTIRAEEAYIEGLDVVAITEHAGSKPLTRNHNRSYDVALGTAKALDILLIRGSEITRSMPPGHWNAIFLQDNNPLDTANYEDAFAAAAQQKAFIFWNHPGWHVQAYEKTQWLDVHTKLFNQGYMHGIEVANGLADGYYPEAHQWALDKNLTMFGNSDSHHPTSMAYDFAKGDHRTMTLVFAKERPIEAIREALENKRTIAWHKNILIGRENLLKELFKQSFQIEKIERKKDGIHLVAKNNSSLTLTLKKGSHDTNLQYFRKLDIKPNERVSIYIGFVQPTSGKVKMDFIVENFYVAPNKGLDYSIEFNE